MNIGQKEDALFDEWEKEFRKWWEGKPENEVKEREGYTFVKDGAPCPDSFKKSPSKCLFILKDANFDPEEKKEMFFDLRSQLAGGETEKEPHLWWETIAMWCAGITQIHTDNTKLPSWVELNEKVFDKDDLARRKKIKDCLKPFAFMQLKKPVGTGSISNNELFKFARKFAKNIKEQIEIYTPEMIVCCGNGKIVAEVLGHAKTPWKETSRGVQYLHLESNDQPLLLVNYTHPSARVAKNIVCYGLLEAYRELLDKRAASRV